MYAVLSGGRGDDGMIQRLHGRVAGYLSRLEERRPLSFSRAGDTAWQAFKDLDKATPASLGAEQGPFDRIPYLRFTPSSNRIRALAGEAGSPGRSGDLHPSIESHIAKYRGLIPRLALITHLIDVGSGPVGIGAVLSALMWAEYLEAHALRLYGAGDEPARAVVRSISPRSAAAISMTVLRRGTSINTTGRPGRTTTASSSAWICFAITAGWPLLIWRPAADRD